ncbi:MAG: integrase core domain-containing protein [Hydrogeniiclostridium mannosilyticum]
MKQEEIYRTSYRSFADCKTHIQEYMNFYNARRPHRANNYSTPDKTEEDYHKEITLLSNQQGSKVMCIFIFNF